MNCATSILSTVIAACFLRNDDIQLLFGGAYRDSRMNIRKRRPLRNLPQLRQPPPFEQILELLHLDQHSERQLY